MKPDKEKEPITIEGLFEEVNELKILITYVIGCQAAIESILQANGITSHKKINALAIGSLKKTAGIYATGFVQVKRNFCPQDVGLKKPESIRRR